MLELKRFLKVEVEPGRSRTVRFELDRGDFALLDADLRPTVEPGRFQIHVGFSADPASLRTTTLTLD